MKPITVLTQRHSYRAGGLLAVAVLAASLSEPAVAGISGVPGIQSVRIWESTYGTPDPAFTFAISDARLTQRLVGATLSGASRDFGNYPGDENYDVFLSDATGSLDPNGSYLTIEGNCFVPYNCFNINAIALVIGGTEFYATQLMSASYGRAGSFTPGSAMKAVDGFMGTFTQMGDTIGLGADARMSITVGFGTLPVPEPGSALLLAGGLLALGLRRFGGAGRA